MLLGIWLEETSKEEAQGLLVERESEDFSEEKRKMIEEYRANKKKVDES